MAVRWPGPPQRSSWIIINWSSPNCYLGSDDGAKKVMNGSSSLKSSTLAPLQPRRAQLRSWWGLWLKLSVTCSTFPRTWQLTPVSVVVCACAGEGRMLSRHLLLKLVHLLSTSWLWLLMDHFLSSVEIFLEYPAVHFLWISDIPPTLLMVPVVQTIDCPP